VFCASLFASGFEFGPSRIGKIHEDVEPAGSARPLAAVITTHSPLM